MKRTFKLIASAAVLISVGLPATSRAFQSNGEVVGSGILPVGGGYSDAAQPLRSTLKPLKIPATKSWVGTAVQRAAATEDVVVGEGDASRPETSRIVQASAQLPPIIKSSARRIRSGVATAPVASQVSKIARRTVARPPIVAQGSSTRAPLPTAESVLDLPNVGGSGTVAPNFSNNAFGTPPTDVRTPNFFNEGNGYQQQPVINDGQPNEFVGPAGSDGIGFADQPIIEDFGTFGSVSASRSYLHLEALFFTREDGDIFGPSIAPLTDFDTAEGFRLTAGRKQDSTSGRELGVTVVTDFSEDVTITNSPLLNVDVQTQSKESDLYSIEYNRVNWGWDLVKTFVGLRFIRFDDSYRIAASTDARGPQPPVIDVFGNVVQSAAAARPAGSALSTLDATNNLFGAHIGGELFYDIGYRLSASVGGKFGLFANLNDFDSTSFIDSSDPFTSEDSNGTVSTSTELNFLAHYQVRQNLRLKIGYNLLFITNVATVSDNITFDAPTLSGVNASDSDDVFFHGLSAGIEFFR